MEIDQLSDQIFSIFLIVFFCLTAKKKMVLKYSTLMNSVIGYSTLWHQDFLFLLEMYTGSTYSYWPP